MGRYFIPLAIFLVLAVFLGVGLRLDPHLVPSPLIGKPAPDFTLPDVKDPNKNLSRKDLLGKVSLVNVWASWCVSCRAEHPLLVELARTGRVTVYGLNYKDQREDALRWLEVLGDPYLLSAFDQDGRVGIDWGVYGTPETFVVDRRGIIRYKHVGPISVEVIEQTILPLVSRLEGEKT
jgi:cytochrome c biogenesis protein CcmG, thiol:disulfide interchange protein DsbE